MLPRDRASWQRDPRVGAAVIVAGVALASFVALGLGLLLAPAILRVDAALSAAIRAVRLPGLTEAARFATWVGDFWQLTVLTLAAAAVYAARGKRTSAAMLLVAVPLGAGVANLLKLVFMRARPAVEALIPMPETYSFPSSHAVSSFALFGALAFLAVLHRASLKRAAVSVALYAVAAACIGLSRVYLGVHYLGDVIGGWLVGAAWLALIVLVFARWGTGDGDGGPTSRGAAGA
jgi:undecaprenyl-diphosphatase